MAWPQDAYVGQKVVCVDASPAKNYNHQRNPLILNKVYTIVEITPDSLPHIPPAYDCMFRIDHSMREWACVRFRPLQSTSTGFSILTALLNPSHPPVGEDEHDNRRITKVPALTWRD